MNSLRRWLYRPKRSDPSLLAQFYFADEELNLIAAELDSFEGRKDPERCTALVNQLRACQARVLNVVSQMMDESVKEQRAPRDFRVKFPDDVIQENLAGQLWFGAECLAAGSSIMNREVESACMRPLARALTKNLDSLRTILREQCLRNVHEYTEQIRESLIIFDKLFAEFELSYVTAMVPVKTAHEYDMIQEITVLFSETVHRALKLGLLTRDMIDEYDPALMFTIPRLAIVSGVLIFKDGPLNPDNDPWNISEMFRPFQTLLLKIRELLGILTDEELNTLERALCSQEEPSFLISLEEDKKSWREERRKSREEKRQKGAGVKAKKKKDESDDGSIESELTAVEIAERLEALALSFEASRNAKQEQTSEQVDPETPSKSSESSSSSSSLLSEGESEEADGPNIVKGEVSDHLDDAQVQRFTNQLYYEANLDSHGLRQDVTLLGPLNAFTPGEIFTTPHSPLDADSSEPGDPTSGAAATPSDSHAQTSGCDADANFENSAAGRTHFAMNKCDSSDSGLHSEVLSNSGSMFTISSSDSNQILGMSDALVRSDSSPDRHSPSPPHHSCVQCDGDCKDDVTANCGSKDVTLLDSRNSSSTLAPESESSCDDDKCLTSPPKERDVASAVTISDEDDIMVSPLEENRRLIDAAETVTPHHTHCDKEATPKEAATSSPVSPNSEDLIAEKNAHTSPSDIQELNCLVSKGNVELEQEDQGQQGDQISGSRGRVSENEIQHIESDLQNHSFAVNGDSESLSKKNIPLEDCQGDLCKPEDACDSSFQNDNMVNGSLPTEAEVSETSASGLPQSNVIATLSFPDHAPISLPLAVEDGGNSDVISECSLVKEELEKDISESAPTNKEPPHTTLSNSRVSDTEPSLTVCSQPHSSPPATTTSQVTTSSPTAAAASNTPCPPVSSSTNEAVQMQTTMPASMSSSSPSSSNERQNHSPSTHPPSRSLTAPSASAPATNHVDTKGPSSKSKGSSRKSSKATETKGRRRGDPTCSSQRTSMPSQAKALMDSQLLDDCYHSSETSSYTSECGDQEEIALAIKAAESATRHQVRARFRSSSDMIHRLFVCISGVADQLQTNFAGDLRNILRAVFDINCSEPIDISEGDKVKDTTPLGAAYRAMSQASRSARRARHSSHQRQDPPLWIPDEQSNECMSCQVPFTFVRRRHHCRNCGKIFCSRCSSNFVPLPHFGQEKAVRVCNRCFMFRVTPFTVRPSS